MSEQIFDDLNNWFDIKDMPKGKRKVLKTAIELFASKGFNGTSTAEIASVSGMSQATVFKYFKTKRELLESIIEPAIEHLIPNYANNFIDDQLPNDVTLRDFINFIVRNRLEFVYANKEIISIFINEIMINDELLSEIKLRLAPMFEKFKSKVIIIFDHFHVTATFDEFIRLVAGQILFEFLKVTKLEADSDTYNLTKASDSISETVFQAVK
ncbi:MAG TPA: TetR/AcrR family transcriptional regulator [Candidatus Aquirickettsiella sp.]|jgi:AcrR family transcriptional regulator